MIAYNVYWIAVITAFVIMRFKEVKGHYPFMSPKQSRPAKGREGSTSSATHSEEARGQQNDADNEKSSPETATKEKHDISPAAN